MGPGMGHIRSDERAKLHNYIIIIMGADKHLDGDRQECQMGNQTGVYEARWGCIGAR